MNDLAGLNWNSSNAVSSNPNGQNSQNVDRFASLRPNSNPVSRQPSPLSSGRLTPNNQTSSASKPAGDSFANLLSSSGGKKNSNLSLQERQKQLLEEKARKSQAEQQREADQYRTNDASFWEGLGSGRNTPANTQKSTPVAVGYRANDEEDILAAFSASAPVDASSHFPPPTLSNTPPVNSGSINQSQARSRAVPASQKPQSIPPQSLLEDNDDPFGLNRFADHSTFKAQIPPHIPLTDDDDILGELGKPIVSKPRPVQAELGLDKDDEDDGDDGGYGEPERAPGGHPQDKAIAELVDMGFDSAKARVALEQTSDGMDVQAAVGFLLTRAHEESRNSSRAKSVSEQHQPSNPSRGSSSGLDGRFGNTDQGGPDRMSRPDRTDTRSPAAKEKDVAKYASDIGGQLFKSANTLWRTGQKRVQKAMADFNQEGNDNQPRWMREAELRERESSQGGKVHPSVTHNSTDEAMMLEQGRTPPGRSQKQDPRTQRHLTKQTEPRAAFTQNQEPMSRPASGAREKLNRQAIEEQSAQAYVSPARRRKTPVEQPPQSASQQASATPQVAETMDIFSDMPSAPVKQTIPPKGFSQSTPPSSKLSKPVTVRPKAVQRAIPPTSPTALSQSNQHRSLGTAAFKRGDFASATSAYSASLATLPSSHPIVIVLQTNLALTHIKTGDAKAALSSADAALRLIGPSQGTDEVISLTNEVGVAEEKSMREFYGKALMRKAEAYEHLEKWTDATQAWRDAVEGGFGGATAMRARQRCEKAQSSAGDDTMTTNAAQRPTPKPAVKKPIPARKPASAGNDLRAASAPPSEAVERLRAANAAAAAASDEAFALNDSVSARINRWKSGKEGNLRALLASLDTVLWEGANWNKVGMGDLVMPNKCKIVYMKAIARVHPDKIPQDATTEQRMVSASVFAMLNEAWDKFKKDNGM